MGRLLAFLRGGVVSRLGGLLLRGFLGGGLGGCFGRSLGSVARTIGPAAFSMSGAIFGPAPFRLETGAKRGKRISGRMSVA